jgi:hypothetical protein
MVERISDWGERRYIGDRANNMVHDTWHPDSQGCGIEDIFDRGDAVGFEPDTLDGALWAGYEYCEVCHDKTDPPRPSDRGSNTSHADGGGRVDPPSAPPGPDRQASRSESVLIRQSVMEVRG